MNNELNTKSDLAAAELANTSSAVIESETAEAKKSVTVSAPSLVSASSTLGTPLTPKSQAIERSPKIFDYDNYREFLSDWFDWKKSEQPSYSGALFAKKAGLSAHTLLGMIIRGQRNLSSETVRSFIRAIGLRGREGLYFEKLVLFNQARNDEDKSYYLEQLLSVSQGEGRKLLTSIKDHASYLSHWYVVAIRELVVFKDFSPEPEWIVKRLKGKITKAQAQEAWELLKKLQMVEPNTDPKVPGAFRLSTPKMDIDPGVVDFAIRNYHREYLERAKRSIDEEDLRDRELSSLTISASSDDLEKIKVRIKEFRKSLNLQFPQAPESDEAPRRHVLAVNMQMLVLTDSLKPETERTREK